MALFQQSLQKRFIKDLDKVKADIAYQRLIAHFGDIDVQENIKKAKEEQYQEGFLRELFVEVLGYILHPQPHYNLITEQKNETNSKKADGAILKNSKPIAVIELKSTKTTDLQAIEIQAFSYKNNNKECVYVITSNFQKIRFYIENAVDFEEFDLFNLSKERFYLLYLCLHSDYLLSDLPLRIKQASIEQEQNITKKLYADYSLFKQTLFQDITAQNKHLDKLTLFKKTQKLLDRFLFIFFAEDKGLLPPNSVLEILSQWEKLKELDEYQPLYSRFKKYFGYLNNGHKGKYHDIFAYNGGLFAPDALLDKLKITDNILYNHCRVLSQYDFDTEVDTNILGHIFEHSLNEIDEFTAAAKGLNIEKGKTKRKKDGIFYTPKYITKYIIERTLGELCRQKKIALGIDNESLVDIGSKKQRKLYQDRIDQYRQWLLQLTILDPACGSGAFLNEALEFLIQEHRLVDSMLAMLFGDSLVMTDKVVEILENNIFGVDINEESVEIARLALWLRTAKVGRKLNDLSHNIKIGNSLISAPAVAGELAFDWQAAFPQVFEKGGFDVVIGNPPYVRQELLTKIDKEFYINQYQVGNGVADLYVYFYEKAFSILKDGGLLGYITPNKFIKAGYGKNLRTYLTQFELQQIVDFGELPVFADAATFPCIFIAKKSKNNGNPLFFAKINSLVFDNLHNEVQTSGFEISAEQLKPDNWQLTNDAISTIFTKMKAHALSLSNYLGEDKIQYGIKTGFNEAFVIDEPTKNELIHKTPQAAEIIKPFIVGDNIRYYKINYDKKYIIFTRRGVDISKYKSVFDYLNHYKIRLKPGTPEGRKAGSYEWYEIQDAVDYYANFEQPKIIYPVIAKEPRFTLDTAGYYFNDKAFMIPTDDKALLAILNSKIVWFYLKKVCSVLGDEEKGGRLELRSIYLKDLPIAKHSKAQKEILAKKASEMLSLTENIQKQTERFIKLLQSVFPSININKKLEAWSAMSFSAFCKELSKQKIIIPIRELMDYQELFETHSAQIKASQHKVNETDKAINELVYALYHLSEEEIQLIEKQHKA